MKTVNWEKEVKTVRGDTIKVLEIGELFVAGAIKIRGLFWEVHYWTRNRGLVQTHESVYG